MKGGASSPWVLLRYSECNNGNRQLLEINWWSDTIKRKNAKLNIAVSPIPQPDTGGKVNFANYWGYAVAKNKTDVLL